MKTVAFTSAAVNYLPKVRLLCESLRKYHPEFEIVLALPDRRSADVAFDPALIDEVIAVEDLDIPDRGRWIYFHAIVELATAIKPFVLKTLLDRPDVERVLYFDPDMVLFSRLDDLLATLDTGAVALTPHQIVPETGLEAIKDNEICSLKHGIFNLGFVGVRAVPEGKRFAGWWADRIYHYCVADICGGLFTDQKWVDFAPVFFEDVRILKEPRFNVATWNLTTRTLAGNADQGFTVDGKPLGFYHFTGFDSGAHQVMASKNAPGNASVQALVDWYRETTRFDDQDPASQVRWAFGTYSDGTPVEQAHRRIYRQRPDLQAAYPEPFEGAGHSLLYWMRHQGPLEYPDAFPKKAAG